MKLFGALLIVAASTWWGLTKASDYTKRVQQLRQLQQAFRSLETEIVYGFTPLAEAFQRISERMTGPIALIFAEVSQELLNHPKKLASEIWGSVLNQRLMKTALKEQDKQILQQLGTQLGSSDRSEQMKHIQLALRMLEGEEKDATEDQKIYPKIYRQLGILAGLLVVILMY